MEPEYQPDTPVVNSTHRWSTQVETDDIYNLIPRTQQCWWFICVDPPYIAPLVLNLTMIHVLRFGVEERPNNICALMALFPEVDEIYSLASCAWQNCHACMSVWNEMSVHADGGLPQITKIKRTYVTKLPTSPGLAPIYTTPTSLILVPHKMIMLHQFGESSEHCHVWNDYVIIIVIYMYSECTKLIAKFKFRRYQNTAIHALYISPNLMPAN